MIYRGTATEEILKALLYKTLSFKDVEKLLKKYKENESVSNASIRNTLYRLKKKGLITKGKTGWTSTHMTEKLLNGRSEFKNGYRNSQKINQKIKTKDQMIVMYDIPESLRWRRDQLRLGLKTLGFKQKQKSVWLGPAPLPKEFVDFMSELEILEYTNFFHVKEKDVV